MKGTSIALLALFFALGGSAFAVTKKLAPQPRCATGAVRAIVEVTGAPDKSAANIPDQYTSSPAQFGRRFSCGGAPMVKRVDRGIYSVKLPANSATSAVASAWGSDPAGATVARQPDGSFLVSIGSHSTPTDESFTLVAF